MGKKEDPMFDGIVKGSQDWYKHQQDIAAASAGVPEDEESDQEDKDDS